MSIKTYLVNQAEKVTGRKCSRCRHNCGGRCCHPNGRMFMKCWQSITRPGFEKRPPRYLKPDTGLTTEEQYQLQKIKGVLQEAEDNARESGLLSTNAKPPLCYDRDKEDFFRNEYRCPECGTFLAAYTYGRAWTDNGLREELRHASCQNCGQEIDWSGVPYPTEEMED